MKQLIVAGMILFSLAACAQTQESLLATSTSLAPTATATTLIEPPETATPSPTPEPFKIENGQLLVYNEQTGVYDIHGEGVDGVTQVGDGFWLVSDSDGLVLLAEQSKENSNDVKLYPWVFDASESISVFTGDEGLRVSVDGQLYTFNTEGQEWEVVEVVEGPIPEGAENHIRRTISGRITTTVNNNGEVVKGPEDPFEVLEHPKSGSFDWRLNKETGEWNVYIPQVFTVTEDSTEVSREVVETAAETVKNAEMFKRMENGEMVELKTGLEERWSESQYSGVDFIHWYGISCGDSFMGVEMDSGDILLIQMIFYKIEHDFSSSSMMFDNGIIPDVDYEGHIDNLEQLGRKVDLRQIAIAVSKSPIGTPFYFTSSIDSDDIVEKTKVWEAMKTGEFLGSMESSYWTFGNIGASNIFYDLAESQIRK